MKVFTIGFTRRTAEQFFEPIKRNKIELLVDVRLNNKSQLAGFTKGKDISYFLSEICDCTYNHNPELSPTQELLKEYKNATITWSEYETAFVGLMYERGVISRFDEMYGKYQKLCLLCSEYEPEHCHRRIVADLLLELYPEWSVSHL